MIFIYEEIFQMDILYDISFIWRYISKPLLTNIWYNNLLKHQFIAMNRRPVMPQGTSGSGEYLHFFYCLSGIFWWRLALCCLKTTRVLKIFWNILNIFMHFHVVPQTDSRSESFFAKVAGQDNSLQMICLNVIFYGAAHPFLSTYFASMS